MPLLLQAGSNPGDATWSPSGTTQITKYLVGTNPDLDYTTIQSAIDAAVADGHEDVDNSALVLIRTGHYVEDLTLYRGVYLQGLPTVIEAVVVEGTVTCDLSDGGGVDKTFTSITGLTIQGGAGDGIVFTGNVAQFLFCTEYSATSSGGRPVVCENTNSSSQFVSRFGRLTALAGNPNPVMTVSGANLVIAIVGGGVMQHDDYLLGATAVLVTAGQFVSDGNAIFSGVIQVDLGGDAIVNNTLLHQSSTTPLLINGSILLGQTNLQGGGAFGVTGTGTVILAGPVVTISGGVGLDPTLSVIYGIADLALTIYHDTTPPGTWAGTPADTMAAINRLAVAVSGLLAAPIP